VQKSEREFEIIVFGATSFVGQILCRYLNQQYGAEGPLRWAIAGRNQEKLNAVNADLGTQLPTIVADAQDRAALESLAARTKVVCTTVGPYALYGSELVAACVQQGTDYCDLTGEPQWMQRMIDKHQAAAAQSGARIVHTCGFDSLPSDLGVLYTQQQSIERTGTHCLQIRMAVKAAKGGMSGGTIASMINLMNEMSRDPELRKVLQNPYAICPPGERQGIRQLNVTAPKYDAEIGHWLAPFVMAAINTRVVMRSNALSNYRWGRGFMYDESMQMKSRLTATAMALGLGGFMGLVAVKPTRKLLQKFVLPEPGQGPSPEQQRAGFFDLRFYGRTADGNTIKTKVTGDRDPGYGSTAKMLGEAAVCLAKDIGDEAGGGFPTPATLFGNQLIDRLQSNAGLNFAVL
jgi:short subunit dehydrogenase-like uncharacterized protein